MKLKHGVEGQIEPIEVKREGSTVLSKIREYFAQCFAATAKVEKAADVVRVPESVAYNLNYCEGQFGKEEILAMMRPEFKGTGIYFTIKVADGDKVFQQKVLRTILNEVIAGADYEKIYDNLSDLLEKKKITEKIGGGKVLQLSRQGFNLYDERFEEIADEINEMNAVPVLMVYAATLGLKPLLEKLPMEGHLVLLNARRLEDGERDLGYIINRTEAGFEFVRFNSLLNLKEMFGGRDVVLVDDTKRTGKTFTRVAEYFASRADWPNVIDQKFVACPGSALNHKH